LTILEDIKGLLNQLIHLANTHLKYYKVVALEKLVELFSQFIAVLILVLTSLVVWLFLSVWLSFTIGAGLDSNGLGFLVMAGINLVLGALLYSFRTFLFVNPLIAWLSTLFITRKEGQSEH
jgi:hypothetical protein